MPFPQSTLPKSIFFGFSGAAEEDFTASGNLLRSRYEKCQVRKAKALTAEIAESAERATEDVW
jgi:hypothetical protein